MAMGGVSSWPVWGRPEDILSPFAAPMGLRPEQNMSCPGAAMGNPFQAWSAVQGNIVSPPLVGSGPGGETTLPCAAAYSPAPAAIADAAAAASDTVNSAEAGGQLDASESVCASYLADDVTGPARGHVGGGDDVGVPIGDNKLKWWKDAVLTFGPVGDPEAVAHLAGARKGGGRKRKYHEENAAVALTDELYDSGDEVTSRLREPHSAMGEETVDVRPQTEATVTLGRYSEGAPGSECGHCHMPKRHATAMETMQKVQSLSVHPPDPPVVKSPSGPRSATSPPALRRRSSIIIGVDAPHAATAGSGT